MSKGHVQYLCVVEGCHVASQWDACVIHLLRRSDAPCGSSSGYLDTEDRAAQMHKSSQKVDHLSPCRFPVLMREVLLVPLQSCIVESAKEAPSAPLSPCSWAWDVAMTSWACAGKPPRFFWARSWTSAKCITHMMAHPEVRGMSGTVLCPQEEVG